METEVIFDLYGQRCMTIFDTGSDTGPVEWLEICTKDGKVYPVEVRVNGRILLNESQLREKVVEWLGKR